MTHLTFFMTGHSNSLAAVDLSNAYIGVDGYDTIIIGALTFCSNWSASLWWAVAGWSLVIDNGAATQPNNEEEDRSALEDRWYDYIITQSALFAIFITVLSFSVTFLRYHLFVWTVFSPKYLYQVAWTCLFHWMAQVVLGTVVVKIYTRSKQSS